LIKSAISRRTIGSSSTMSTRIWSGRATPS
jgi:hypothetical protein